LFRDNKYDLVYIFSGMIDYYSTEFKIAKTNEALAASTLETFISVKG
jgi:hypothetical protein